MTKNTYNLSHEVFQYLAFVLPSVDVFTIIIVAFTSANPWITTPINLLFPVIGIISTKVAVKLSGREQQDYLYFVVLPLMAIGVGFLAYYGGTDCPAWVQAFPVITAALYLVYSRAGQIVIALMTLVALFLGYWLQGASAGHIASILLAGVAFAAIMERTFSYLVNQQQRMEQQKKEIELKNSEIIDSISYAKRIQAAILPTDKIISEMHADTFVLYKPKDIVSGDFYWFHQSGDSILFAACDCTGHGVPGAMVSVVCFNSLNEAVKMVPATAPDQLLNSTRQVLIEQFQKSEEDIKDGMDISMCSFVPGSLRLKWAGANNSLYIVRNGEVLETKADKQPIGKHVNMKPFTLHDIALQKNDHLYIFTDGYHDQFGGTDGKKMKRTYFKDVLIAVSKEPFEKQKQLLNEAFEKWKAGCEQLDDVCIIGVRI